MPRLDGEKRITIPYDIRNETSIGTAKKIVFFYEDGKVFLANSNIEEEFRDKLVVSKKSLDSKGRIYISSYILELLDATVDDIFIIALLNDKICMLKK